MRLFLAAPLPDQQRAAVAAAQEELRPRVPKASWVKSAGAHITLRFIGDPRSSVEELGSALSDAFTGFKPQKVELSELGAFPSLSKPRAIWVRASGLEDLALKADLALKLVGLPVRDKPFIGHITLCRLKKAPKRGLQKDVLDFRMRDHFLLTELILFTSELLPAGAVHTPLLHFPIGD